MLQQEEKPKNSENSNEFETVDVDTMLSYAGDFNKYQFVLMVLFSIINFLSAFHYFGQTFISSIPEFWCKNTTGLAQGFSKCKNHEDNSSQSIITTCSSGWEYNSSYGYISIVQQLNWVCDKDWIPALGQSVFFVGSVVGSLGLGILADHIGRLHVVVIANMLALIGNFITLLSADAISFVLSRFIAGSATDSNFVMMYIIVMEYIRPQMRTFGLNICIGVFYCAACVLVPWVAVLSHTWKTFLLIVSVPHISVLGFYFFVPESAQWLLSKGKTEKAITCFQQIALINGKTIPKTAIEGLKQYVKDHVEARPRTNSNILGLFKTPKLRRKTLILIFKSMVITLCYDAISRNINNLGYTPFALFSMTSTTILPACLIILALQDIIGRKAMASGSLFTSGLFTCVSAVTLASITDINPLLTLCLAVVARLGINVAYNSGAQYAVELIPTEVRGQGVSAIHVAGYAASFFSSQILYLGNYWRALPEIVLGVLLIMGAFACMFLPETLNKTLPVTLEDGELFGEEESFWQFSCFTSRSDSQLNLTNKEEIVPNYSSTN